MAAGQRTTKGAGRRLPSRRALLGRSGYFPVRTRRKQGIPALSQSYKPDVPADWQGTAPEWALFQAALQIGLQPHIDFEYQYPIASFGVSADVDFLFFPTKVIEVQGLYWHYAFGGLGQQNDAERKARIESIGYDYVAIDEDALVGPRADPVFYLKAALEGRDYSRAML